MRKTIIIQDNLSLHYGILEPKSKVLRVETRPIWINPFNELRPSFQVEIKEYYNVLRMGDGIKTFQSQDEIDQFLVALFLQNINPIKLFNINQLHTKVGPQIVR